jgi:hypothetical protein
MMMWLLGICAALNAEQVVNLLSAALCLALAAGMNERAGLVMGALLALALVVMA